MNEQQLSGDLYSAILAGSLERVRSSIGAVGARVGMMIPPFGTLLHVAAGKGKLDIVKYLVTSGADINRRGGLANATALQEAASDGHVEIVRYLLASGAEMDVSEPERNPLFAAIQQGCTASARLLIEAGIDTRVNYSGQNMHEMDALAYAREWGRKDIADLLIASGCDDTAKSGRHPTPPHPVMNHILTHLGAPLAVSLGQILPTHLPIHVHVVPRNDGTLALVTTGMSDAALTVPDGKELYQYAELMMILPGDWPYGAEALTEPEHSWPYEWLQKVATFPHESETWLRPAVVIDCGGPVAPNTAMSCLLAYTEESEVGRAETADGRTVVFYFVVPIYPEERDLRAPRVLELLQEHGFAKEVVMNRPNLALHRRG